MAISAKLFGYTKLTIIAQWGAIAPFIFGPKTAQCPKLSFHFSAIQLFTQLTEIVVRIIISPRLELEKNCGMRISSRI
jgi:hypothetical protein